jgi:hypothetical protein
MGIIMRKASLTETDLLTHGLNADLSYGKVLDYQDPIDGADIPWLISLPRSSSGKARRSSGAKV